MSNILTNKEQLLHHLLSQNQFGSERLEFVTNRQIHHWKEIGLLDDNRKYAASGIKSKFTFYEALWIKMIIDIRGFRISNISIQHIKNYLFQNNKDVTLEKEVLFEQIIRQVILNNEVIFLILLQDMSVSALNKETYLSEIKKGGIDHHFSLRFDVLIKELLTSLDMVSDIHNITGNLKNTNKYE